MGSPLTTVTMDRATIGTTFPELVTRRRGAGARHLVRGPLAAGPGRAWPGLQGRPHRRGGRRGPGGLRLVQDPEGFATECTGRSGRSAPRFLRNLVARSVAGRRMVIPPEAAIGGVRPAQQDMYEMISQSKPVLYSEAMWQRLGDHSPYSDLDITERPDAPVAPAEPVALRRLQGDARRPADDLQGRPDRHERLGRDPLSVPRRRRDLLLLGHRSGVQAARHDREVDPPPGRGPDPAASGSPTAPRRCSAPAWRRPSSAPTALPGSTSSSAPNRSAPPATSTWPRVLKQRSLQTILPRLTPARFIFDVALTCVAQHPALASHLLRRRSLRPAGLAAARPDC